MNDGVAICLSVLLFMLLIAYIYIVMKGDDEDE